MTLRYDEPYEPAQHLQSDALRHTQERKEMISTYLNADETVKGFGYGGSESLTMFLKFLFVDEYSTPVVVPIQRMRSLMKSGCLSLLMCFAAVLAVLTPREAAAQVQVEEPPDVEGLPHAAGQGPNTGGGGGHSTSVPLDLPAARGGLPVPVSLVHGGTRMGAAGRGWDVPLSTLRADRSFAHRRPTGTWGGAALPRLQMTLTLLGQSVELIKKGTDWIPQRDATGLTVRQQGTEWKVYDRGGLTYTFSHRVGDDLWLLSRIEGPRQAKVELDYDIMPQVLPGTGGTSIDLARVKYNHSGSGSPKHEVSLVYGSPQTRPLSISVDQDLLFVRMRKLERIVVSSRAQVGGALATLASYRLHYGVDPDTQLPRLESVAMSGRAGTPEADTELPLARYEYGTATQTLTQLDGTPSVRLRYVPRYALSLPFEWDESKISSSELQSATSRFVVPQALVDVSGDGRADLVYQAAGVPGLQVNRQRPGSLGEPNFLSPGYSGSLNDASMQKSGLGSFGEETGFVDPFPVDRPHETTESHRDTWSEFVDANGDGRPDLIDAYELSTNQWVVYINRPANDFTHSTTWVRKVYDVSSLKSRLTGMGHVLPSGRVPLMRQYTSNNYSRNQCWEYDYANNVWKIIACSPNNDVIWENTTSTATAWKLMDFNGDGGLDLLLTSERPRTTRGSENTNPPCYPQQLDPPLQPQPGSPGCFIPPQAQRFYVRDGAHHGIRSGGTLLVAFNNQPVTEAIPNSIPLEVGGCGIGYTSTQFYTEGSTMDLAVDSCSLQDINADGLVDVISYAAVSGAPFYSSAVADLGTGLYFLETKMRLPGFTRHRNGSQTRAYNDLTGDGIPDYIDLDGSRHVRIGTGADFGPKIDISGEFGSNPFSISVATNAAASSKTLRGLYDLDGDGKPEYVVNDAANNRLKVYGIAGNQGPRALSAGLLTKVENGHGAITEITYRSAKDDATTPHQVPFPEIVVSSVRTVQTSTSVVSETKYAYGDARLGFDSLAGGFRSFGYGRSIAMTTVGPRTPGGDVQGNATITDTYPLVAQVAGNNTSALFERYLRAGRTKDVTVLSGQFSNFFSDPWNMLTINVATDGRRIGGTSYTYNSKVWPDVQLDAACVDIVDPYAPYLTPSMNVCRTYGFLFQQSVSSWRGDGAPPTLQNVMTDGSVRAIDDFGRVTEAYVGNDSRRSDDNLCVKTIYATPPANTFPRVLTAVAESSVRQSGEPGQCYGVTLAVQRREYDNLPAGSVSAGFLTAQTVERRDSQTGALLDTVPSFSVVNYDALGNPTLVRSESGDGRDRTVSTTYDPFGLATTSTKILSTGLPQLLTSYTLDPLTLQPLSVTDPNQIKAGFTYDGFGRPLISTVTPQGGTAGALSLTQYLGFAGGDPLGRRVVVKTFDNPVPPATVSVALGHTTTTYLDDVARATRAVVDLGQDYADDLVVGAVTYDEFGRAAFVADPFPSSQDPATAYGTTNYFWTDGTPKCSIRGHGKQSLVATTDEASERYPTCFQRLFSGGTERVIVRTPDALLPGSPQHRVYREATMSAIGRILSRETWSHQRLEYAEFQHDPLGNVVKMTRFKNPGNPVPPQPSEPSQPVAWTFGYDSLGQVLRQDEPDTVTRFSEYSRWGELMSTRTPASTTPATPAQEQRMTYDALGRLTHSEQRSGGNVVLETVNDYQYDFGAAVHPALPVTSILGQLAAATSPTSTVYFGYDAFGRVNAQATEDPERCGRRRDPGLEDADASSRR